MNDVWAYTRSMLQECVWVVRGCFPGGSGGEGLALLGCTSCCNGTVDAFPATFMCNVTLSWTARQTPDLNKWTCWQGSVRSPGPPLGAGGGGAVSWGWVCLPALPFCTPCRITLLHCWSSPEGGTPSLSKVPQLATAGQRARWDEFMGAALSPAQSEAFVPISCLPTVSPKMGL